MIINDGLLATNLPKANALIKCLVVEIGSINNRLENNTVVFANPDMLRRARQVAVYVAEDTKALRPALIAANKLSEIIDDIKVNTKLRQKSHQDVQR